ncbi:hypothetical protein BB561_002141 [Smittium simulii]|uniref:Pumilio homology domain family member 3 n=1 Tax=Smittium simulii TaxID=133385 RepID=A0A2T9YRG3_9FUNG|nr:hypothetical protein BB561_002141 [Smittium simulii]
METGDTTRYNTRNSPIVSLSNKAASRFFADSNNYSYSSPKITESSDVKIGLNKEHEANTEHNSQGWQALFHTQNQQLLSNSFSEQRSNLAQDVSNSPFKNQVQPRSIYKNNDLNHSKDSNSNIYSESDLFFSTRSDLVNVNPLPNISAKQDSRFFVSRSLLEIDEFASQDLRANNPSSSYQHNPTTIDLNLSNSVKDISTKYHNNSNVLSNDINSQILVNSIVDSDGESKIGDSSKIKHCSNSSANFKNIKKITNFHPNSASSHLRSVSTPPKRFPNSHSFNENFNTVGHLSQHLSNVSLNEPTLQKVNFGAQNHKSEYYPSVNSHVDALGVDNGNLQAIDPNLWYQNHKPNTINNQHYTLLGSSSVYKDHDNFAYPMLYQNNNFQDENFLPYDMVDNGNDQALSVSAYSHPFGINSSVPKDNLWAERIEQPYFDPNNNHYQGQPPNLNSIHIQNQSLHNQNTSVIAPDTKNTNQILNQDQRFDNMNDKVQLLNVKLSKNQNANDKFNHASNNGYSKSKTVHAINNNIPRLSNKEYPFNQNIGINYNQSMAQNPYHSLNSNMMPSVASQQNSSIPSAANSNASYPILLQNSVSARYNQSAIIASEQDKKGDYFNFNQGYNVATPIPIQQPKYPQQNGFPTSDYHSIPQNMSFNSVPNANLANNKNMAMTPIGFNMISVNTSPLFSGSSANYNKSNTINSNETSEQTTRSSVLEEFRNSKTRKYELQDIRGYIVEFSTDQYGSRFIQQKLEICSAEDKLMVFQEILPHALHLMSDVFGNYVIQKFFDFGSAPQKHMLAIQMSNNILTLSLQMYGCRVVQKALEHVGVDLQTSIIRELDGYVLKCVKDQNGNHVIQKTIECVEASKIGFIINSFHGQVFQLATHPYGCRVIQRLFEHCSDEKTRSLLNELQKYIPGLVQDQYGNYVIQHILEHGNPTDRTMIINRIQGNILRLSKHKFASNVVEKCIAYGNPTERKTLINEVIQVRQDDTCGLVLMMKDQYANYVVQKMLDVVGEDQRAELLAVLQPHLTSLRRFTYGRHLINKVEALLSNKQIANANGAIDFSSQQQETNLNLSPTENCNIEKSLSSKVPQTNIDSLANILSS